MYKNLNDYTSTTLDVKFNNSKQLTDIGKQVGTSIVFTKNDIITDVITGKKQLFVYDRIIKHCLIKCPDGQVWNALDYKYQSKSQGYEKDCTIFDFSYVQDSQWLSGNYYIYVGATNVNDTFSNEPTSNGVQLLRNSGQHHYFKKLLAGNGIRLISNINNVIIQTAQHNFTSEPIQFGEQITIDLFYGNLQIGSMIENSSIIDIINTSYITQTNQNDDSYSSSSSDNPQQVLSVSLIVYKPNQTTLKYNNLSILQKYDIGWFAFTIRKMFGKLFISQPTRIITDFEI